MLHIKAQELQYHLEAILREHPELQADEDMKLDTLEGEGFDEILAAVVEKSLEARSMADAIKSRMDALSERRSRFQRQDTGWRLLALRLMQSVELDKHQIPEATVSVTKGRQTVRITGTVEDLPEEFQRVKVEPDKKALLDALETGPVDGATLSNGPPTLTIRTR